MEHQLRRIARRVLRVAHGPVIAHGVGKERTVSVEIRGGNSATSRHRKRRQTLMRFPVPEAIRAIRPSGAKSSLVRRMKADVVDSPHLDDLTGIGLIAMAAKCKVDAPGLD